MQILEEAESLYGPRDRSYEILEPELFDGDHTHGEYIQRNKIKLYLSRRCADNYYYASYDLAHEAIHMLSPVFYGEATILEEGLATYFSHRYVKRLYGWNIERCPDRKYDAAMRAAAVLLAKNESAIKELRVRQPVISKINARMLVEVIGIEPRLARFLASDFETYGLKPLTWTEQLARDADLAYNFVLALMGIGRR
jgi:hypothetical protein